jgi:pectinesterase
MLRGTKICLLTTIVSVALLCPKMSSATIANTAVGVIKRPDKVVAKDGSGDYTTIQAAIDAAPAGRDQFYIILIRKGVYKELINIPKGKNFIYLKGEGAANTILTFDNSARKLAANGKEYGTFGSSSTYILGDNFKAEDLTFENSSGTTGGQALAISVSGDRAAFRNCSFLGHQDTFYAAGNTIQYFKNCFIAGTVDFIFGASTAYFEDCTLHSIAAGYLTAASTPQGQKYGYVFSKCKLTAEQSLAKSKVYLGRPWRPYANVVFLNCDMGEHIRPEGWHNWGKVENEKTAFYAEYNSKGNGFQSEKRVPWSKLLTPVEVKEYTKIKILGNWAPF